MQQPHSQTRGYSTLREQDYGSSYGATAGGGGVGGGDDAARAVPTRFQSRFIRIFFLLSGFDTLFCLLLYIITGKTASTSGGGGGGGGNATNATSTPSHNSVDDLNDYFYTSVVDFQFEYSIFDVMMLAPSRFIVLFLILIGLNWRHGLVVAFTTIVSTAYLLAKVFYYDFAHSVASEYLLFIFAFLFPWTQAWTWSARSWRERRKQLDRHDHSSSETTRLLGPHSGVAAQPSQQSVAATRLLYSGSSLYQTPTIATPAYITRYGNAGEVSQIVEDNRATSPNNFEETPFGTPPDKPFDELVTLPSTPMDSAPPTINSLPASATPEAIAPPAKPSSAIVSRSPNPSKDPELVRIATEALDLMWEMSTSNEGWNVIYDKTDLQIYWKQSPTVKVFKSVSILNISPADLFDMLFHNIEEQPTWNKNVSEYKILYTIDDKTDVTFTQTAEAAGGMVSPRDFVTARQWRKIGNSYMGAGKSVVLDAYPPRNNVIRGWNEPGGFAMLEVPQQPNLCCFVWIINTDLKGWLPRYIIDQTMSGAMTLFAVCLNERIQYVKSLKGKK